MLTRADHIHFVIGGMNSSFHIVTFQGNFMVPQARYSPQSGPENRNPRGPEVGVPPRGCLSVEYLRQYLRPRRSDQSAGRLRPGSKSWPPRAVYSMISLFWTTSLFSKVNLILQCCLEKYACLRSMSSPLFQAPYFKPQAESPPGSHCAAESAISRCRTAVVPSPVRTCFAGSSRKQQTCRNTDRAARRYQR